MDKGTCGCSLNTRTEQIYQAGLEWLAGGGTLVGQPVALSVASHRVSFSFNWMNNPFVGSDQTTGGMGVRGGRTFSVCPSNGPSKPMVSPAILIN